jgi:hypothetical protein
VKHRIRAGLAVFTLIAFVLILQSFQPSRADRGDALAATYSRGSLRVTIPYRAPHAGTGQLRVEILDPEERVLARSERRVEIAGGKDPGRTISSWSKRSRSMTWYGIASAIDSPLTSSPVT